MIARRALALGLAALLLAGVGGGVWYSRTALVNNQQAQLAQQQAITARGLIGSEKEPFFQDERVRAVLARHGVTVNVQKAGSRSIANSYDAKQFDFGFPSGAPAAAQLKAGTPLILATRRIEKLDELLPAEAKPLREIAAWPRESDERWLRIVTNTPNTEAERAAARATLERAGPPRVLATRPALPRRVAVLVLLGAALVGVGIVLGRRLGRPD